MPQALDESVRDQVRRSWFSGQTRKNIAAECGIGAGSVTNIIDEWAKGLDSSDYESIRELAVQLKKEGMTFAQLASIYRHHNYIKKLGANEREIEVLIANLQDKTKSIPIEKTADLVNQLYELSKSESIPPVEVPAYINRKIEDKARLDAEIQESRAILDQESVDVQNLNEYKKSKEELKKYRLSTEAPDKLIPVIQSFSEMGYDPQKIVTNYAHIKSLRQTVRGLSKECRILESRAARYNEIIPLCEQIDSFGIGFPELVAFRSAVFRIAEMENLSYGDAAFVMMARIDTPGKIAYLEKQLNDKMMNIQMVNLVSARQKDAIMALARLQLQGITENQILNACRRFEMTGHNLNGVPSWNSKTYPIF